MWPEHDLYTIRRTQCASCQPINEILPCQPPPPRLFFFSLNGTKSGFEICFGPSTLGAGAKTLLETRIKKFNPHCICQCAIIEKNETRIGATGPHDVLPDHTGRNGRVVTAAPACDMRGRRRVLHMAARAHASPNSTRAQTVECFDTTKHVRP